MKYIFVFIAFFYLSITAEAQNNAGLQKLTGAVEKLRTQKATKTTYSTAISTLSNGKEKITLLDDISTDQKAEYHGTNSDRFRLNSVVSQVYAVQTGVNVSKGNYYDSRERGKFYSLIEKSVKPGATADFTITEHIGNQEIVILPFSDYESCTVTVSCKDRKVQSGGQKSKYLFTIDGVTKEDVIHIHISNKAKQFVSFAILNYNPQK